MTVQRIFIALLIIFTLSCVLWYVLVYQPLVGEELQKKKQLAELHNQLKQARVAEKDLEAVQSRFKEKEKELAEVKSRFIDKKDLSRVTDALRKSAERFDLKIVDFTPVLDSYFNDNGKGKIKPLPIMLTVRGRYIQIGKFLEEWHSLDFYLVPYQIFLEKMEANQNTLRASIMSNLYTLNP
ncbi:MAG: hypothetical protein Kow0042_14560 [Calditrichia bacterium]